MLIDRLFIRGRPRACRFFVVIEYELTVNFCVNLEKTSTIWFIIYFSDIVSSRK